MQVIFNNRASEELEGPNIFKALEHVSLRARITMDPQKRLNVMLELEKNMSTRQLFNELHTFLEAASDFVKTKVGMRDQMNIQESEEFKTSKFYCKTDFDMKEIKKEEAEYVPLPKFYTFKSRDARERILYANFLQVNKDVKEMIDEIFAKKRAK